MLLCRSRTSKNSLRIAEIVAFLALVVACGPGCSGAEPAVEASSALPPQVTASAPPADLLERAFAPLDESPETIQQFTAFAAPEDVSVLDVALGRIFGESKPPLDEATCLQVMAYVTQVLKNEFLGSPVGSDALKAGHGYCTEFALSFVVLCQRLGFPARTVHLPVLELMQGHVVAEVYYDGAWRLFDPVYGTFFYTQKSYDGAGRIVSLREVLTRHALLDNCMELVLERHTGNFVPGTPEVRPLEDFQCGQFPFTLKEFYGNSFRRGFPAAYGHAYAVSFPIDIDLTAEPHTWIGAVDNSDLDQYGQQRDGKWPLCYGARHIGETPYFNAFLTFTLKTTTPGRCLLTLHFFNNGADNVDLRTAELKNVIVERVERQGNAWQIQAVLQDKETILVVASEKGVGAIDAIRAEFTP